MDANETGVSAKKNTMDRRQFVGFAAAIAPAAALMGATGNAAAHESTLQKAKFK